MSQDSVDTAVNQDICPRFQKLGDKEDKSSLYELNHPDPNFQETYPRKIPNVNWHYPNGRCPYARMRTVIENGQLIKEPTRRWMVYLKGDLPSDGDNRLFHLRFLEKVTSRADAALSGSSSSMNVFDAYLTDEEYEKLLGMSEVAETEEVVMSCVVIA